MSDSRSLSSPGSAAEKPNLKEKAEEEIELDVVESTVYRRAAARINYMALDRSDLVCFKGSVQRYGQAY